MTDTDFSTMVAALPGIPKGTAYHKPRVWVALDELPPGIDTPVACQGLADSVAVFWQDAVETFRGRAVDREAFEISVGAVPR
jgi:hypothetical protein